MKKDDQPFLVGSKHPYLEHHRPRTFHKPLVHGGGENHLAMCGLLIADSTRETVKYDTIVSDKVLWWPCGNCFPDEWKTWPQPPPLEREEPLDYLIMYSYNSPNDQYLIIKTLRRVYASDLLEELNDLASMTPMEGYYLEVIEIKQRAEIIKYSSQQSAYVWEKET